MGLGKHEVARLARTLSEQSGVVVSFKGSWPVTDGANVSVPDSSHEGWMVGSVDAMAAVAESTDHAVLGQACGDELVAQLYCGIEAARCLPEFSKRFGAAPHHVGRANRVWEALVGSGRLDELSTAVASVGLSSFGIDADHPLCEELRGLHPELYARAGASSSAQESYELALAFAQAFERFPNPDGGEGDGDGEDEDEDGDGGAESRGAPKAGRAAAFPKGKGSLGEEGGEGSPSDADAGRKRAGKELSKARWAVPEDQGGAAKSIPLHTDLDKVERLDGRGDPSEASELARAALPAARAMVAKFERALKSREKSKWRFERERGAIDPRSLAKLSASPGFRAPFKEKKVAEASKVALSVLIDLSGSMASTGADEMARVAAMALGMAMERLGIDCEILGFSSGDCEAYQERGVPENWSGRWRESLALRVFKSFGSASLRAVACAAVDDEAPQNPDGEGVSWCASRLAARHCKRRILMVLSDGRPETEDTSASLLADDLRSRVKAIEAAGIETIGVGLNDRSVARFYSNWVVVRDLEQLAGEALGKLSEILLEGMAADMAKG